MLLITRSWNLIQFCVLIYRKTLNVLGANPQKLSLGLPSYGRSFKLKNPETDHNNSNIRIWVSGFNREFGTFAQQDAEEFLRILINNCEI